MNILYPMFGMILLSCFVVIVFYLSRLVPVIKNFGNLESARYSDEFRSQLPVSLKNITANYNHIFEQPTLYYAVIIYIYLMQHVDITNIILAWSYVALRLIHTIIQFTINNVSLRVIPFILSGLCLVIIIIREFLFFYFSYG